ncbi:LuxR C-terminal-related transcriptional regulator [Streptomyces sp. HUAS TT7]|uniref:response regulator transcription factor n=1 Tax=Streptomyces sp. HUAS TT7 TaxID=3447507 RepID=UPI003F656F76
MITVLPVSGDRHMRRVLREHLLGGRGINTVEEAWDATTARERVRVLLPDAVVVHAGPGAEGLAIAQEIGHEPHSPRILLVGSPEDRLAEAAICTGASGLLSVNSLHKDLVRAVRAVVAGHAFFSSEMTRDVVELASRRVWTQRVPAQRKALDALTDRQHEVLELLATGMSNAEIAESLGLRPGTVKTHVSQVLARLGAQNRVEAARIVFGPCPAAR